MSEHTSPVPKPAVDARAPEIYREHYGMPMFVTVPTADFLASVNFWTRGLGFVDFFSIPGQLTHLRRWAFQDVLLMPGEPARVAPAAGLTVSCVLTQIDEAAARCEELLPGCTSGPTETPWNSTDLTVVTPENTRVVLTAARPIDPDSAQAQHLRALGFEFPEDPVRT